MNYTMTFYCRDCLSVPDDSRMRQRHVRTQVLDKMQGHQLELVDFNLTENYHTYPGYNNRGRAHKTLVEIRLDLSRGDLISRDSIYNRCLAAMEQGELYLSDFEDREDEGKMPSSILIFDMKRHVNAS